MFLIVLRTSYTLPFAGQLRRFILCVFLSMDFEFTCFEADQLHCFVNFALLFLHCSTISGFLFLHMPGARDTIPFQTQPRSGPPPEKKKEKKKKKTGWHNFVGQLRWKSLAHENPWKLKQIFINKIGQLIC